MGLPVTLSTFGVCLYAHIESTPHGIHGFNTTNKQPKQTI
jgi:hypothetical protein